MSLSALIFDVDGTLADTEEAHRRGFEAAFRSHDLDWSWGPALYRDLLAVTGGKERLLHYVRSLALPEQEEQRLAALVPQLHAAKTRSFAALVAAGGVALRPGIARLLGEARAAGLRLAIASTTTPANVEALLSNALGQGGASWFDVIATGDVVARKKPAPDVYELALAKLGLAPERCVAFEDSAVGLRSAQAAGLFTVVVPTQWTAGDDLSSADLLLPSLGDPDAPLDAETASGIGGSWLDLSILARCHAQVAAGRREKGTRCSPIALR